MEEKVKEIVEIKHRNLAEENQKTLEILKERYRLAYWTRTLNLDIICFLIQLHTLTTVLEPSFSKLLLLTKTIDSSIVCREQLLQDQLQSAKESVSNMKKLHELAQNQLFELRAQSGNQIVFKSGHTLIAWICNINYLYYKCSLTSALCLLFLHFEIMNHRIFNIENDLT